MTDSRLVPNTRARIIEVAARLLQDQGAKAVTTRGVAAEAGVQAPAIYRLFGDKDGLVEAVAEHVMATYVSTKVAIVEEAEATCVDPLDDLRAGWRAQMDFGLGNPTLFRLLSDPDRAANSPAVRLGKSVLETRMHRMAVAGRLKVPEGRAVELFQAAGIGVTTVLLAMPPAERDLSLIDAVLEGVLAQILIEGPARTDAGLLATTIAFRAVATTVPGLSSGERQLLTEWLDRAIASEAQPNP